MGRLSQSTCEHKISRGMCSETYKAQPVGRRIGLDVLHHVPVRHPLRYDSEMSRVLRHGDPQQRQDVGMSQAFPDENFPTKLLDVN